MKRFLAFSSISQAGYIMLGVIAFNAMGTAAMIYYILVYIFSNLAAFGVIGAIENATGKVSMDDYRGLYKTNPRLSFAMMLAMFSLAGIPPFAGFFSKFFIFTGAINQGSVAIYVLVLIALINTIISLYYYLLVVKAMFISDETPVIENFRSSNSERLGLWITIAGVILLGIASCVYSGLLNLTADGPMNMYFLG
jgi:NADH-quinone oxidoreductase subunit N